MKAKVPQRPEHHSYLLHRKQRVAQIILPVLLSTLVFIGFIVWVCLATFQQEGDVGRWAAISTMWIVIPIMIAGLVLLALLIGLIYLLARGIGVIPHYTGIAQDYVYKAQAYIIRGANMATKPVFIFRRWIDTVKAFFERVTP